MTIEARKISLVQEFLRIDNEDIIKALEDLLHQSKIEAFKKNFNPMSLEEFNSEIDKALDDEENYRLTSVKTLKKKIQKWS
ncbi:hypothetical protein SAMN05216365_12336 [Porphyromonadaceae bacterium NLAE-zl-C104]|jgi:hypothetical protein|uniref:hypothetical protein n=1 Tax=Proteiniphilum TaxID=294702 RepID=UPI0008986A98|nr:MULTISPECIES: hypothetical protein [Proteiniphilum]MDY9918421.1 hypothetical protein [Proteiniphilum sp.]SDZ79553.1 hypothetical protein SAMN05216331_10454 [Porphyromonadaceae bacterium KH3R12]SFS85318.1 hypothetical protein SAMN05216365_12336 [Porphyromonadaceae bacterium NLAE-zl-C104]